jgi:hypothetical protein
MLKLLARLLKIEVIRRGNLGDKVAAAMDDMDNAFVG